jgi:hypothetical protein
MEWKAACLCGGIFVYIDCVPVAGFANTEVKKVYTAQKNPHIKELKYLRNSNKNSNNTLLIYPTNRMTHSTKQEKFIL